MSLPAHLHSEPPTSSECFVPAPHGCHLLSPQYVAVLMLCGCTTILVVPPNAFGKCSRVQQAQFKHREYVSP